MNRLIRFRRGFALSRPRAGGGGVRGVRPGRVSTVRTRSGHGAFALAPAMLLAVCSASSGAGGGPPAGPLVVDPRTFTVLPAGRPSARAPRRAGAHRGPRIALLSPRRDAVFRAGELVALHARFLPAADGAAPDMETLSVRVRQGRRGQDVTEKVRLYLEGTSLRVPAVDFLGHAGELRFELDVMDERGRLGGAELRVTFRLEFRDALRLDGETQGGR